MIELIRHEIGEAFNSNDYVAVDLYWSALLKLANLMPGNEEYKEEYKRVKNLVKKIPTDEWVKILSDPGVDRLLGLDPPLETVLASQHEGLDRDGSAKDLEIVRSQRVKGSLDAVLALGRILKRIRDKREHGFKTMRGLRDTEILNAARSILSRICEKAIEAFSLSEVREIK